MPSYAVSMPAKDRIDPTWPGVVASQLARSGAAALEASHELLAHYGDTGETASQRGVDILVNQAVGALGALTDSLGDASRTLQEAGHRAASQATRATAPASRARTSPATTRKPTASRARTSRAPSTGRVEADGSSAAATRARDHDA